MSDLFKLQQSHSALNILRNECLVMSSITHRFMMFKIKQFFYLFVSVT
jgi:hypothetical protein